MSDEKPKRPERILYVTPRDIGVDVAPDGSVAITIDVPPEAGLAAHLGFAAILPAPKARELARLLQRKADEAEAGLPHA
jgi:hypothetical protein